MRSNLLANNPNKQILWLYDCPVQDSEMTTDVLWHWRGVTKLMKSKNQSVNEIVADILLLLSILIVKVSLGSIILIRVDKMFCCTLQSPVSSLQCSVLLTFRGCWGASQLPPDIYHIDIPRVRQSRSCLRTSSLSSSSATGRRRRSWRAGRGRNWSWPGWGLRRSRGGSRRSWDRGRWSSSLSECNTGVLLMTHFVGRKDSELTF